MQKFLLSFFVVVIGSVAVAATIFLNHTQVEEATAATATCQTGFSRPLLFGINIPWDITKDTPQRVKELGGTATRVGYNWPDVEQQRGVFNENQLKDNDLIIDQAEKAGITVVGLINGTPDWASDGPRTEKHRKFPRDSDRDEYIKFVTKIVTRNKGIIKYWAYWNEPNGCGSSAPSCAFSDEAMKEYIKWLNVTNDTIKAIDPSIQVIGGELDYHTPVPDQAQFMKDKGARYDILAIHPYDNDQNGLDFNAITGAHERSGKPVWLTEYTWGKSDAPISDEKGAPLLASALNTLATDKYNFVTGAFYLGVYDFDGGTSGLSDKNPDENGNTKIRLKGQAFLDASKKICDPVGTSGSATAPPPNKPVTNGEIPITIRTYYSGTIANTVWPKINVYLNNASNYDGPYDYSACDGSYQGPPAFNFCGKLNKFEDKLIDSFDATGSNYRDITINASKLVPNLITSDIGTTKLSYAFVNDVFIDGQDRNFAITKIEIYGPSTETSGTQSKLLLTFTPGESDSYHGGYSSNSEIGQLANSFYFDFGFIEPDGTVNANNNGMVKGFDKKELKTIKEMGSREAKAWKLDQEGTFNVVSQEIQKVIRTIYNLNSVNAACVVASHDIGTNWLKRGQPITVTSVASVPIATYKFAFYNNDNKVNNIPQPFCVKGATKQPNDGCPAGSGQMIITSTGTRKGAVQAVGWLKLPNGEVLESMWRGDIGWNRPLPFTDNFGQQVSGVTWNFSSYLGIEQFGIFPSTAEIDAIDFYANGTNKGGMEIWRNNILTRYQFNFNSQGNYPDWSTSTSSRIVDLYKNPKTYPGDGVISAAGSFVSGNKLMQIHWRGNQEWIRSVPLSNGAPNFAQASTYTLGRSTSSLPVPNAKVQAINYITMPNGDIQEHLWQNDAYRSRIIKIKNGSPDFAGASQYSTPTSGGLPVSEQTTSETLQYNQVHQLDMKTNKIPENLQVNATFVSKSGATIGDNAACVVKFAFDKSLDGDVDGNCVNDIYDYNALLENYGTTNCQYNLTGDSCTIDMADIDYLKARFGQKCE